MFGKIKYEPKDMPVEYADFHIELFDETVKYGSILAILVLIWELHRHVPGVGIVTKWLITTIVFVLIYAIIEFTFYRIREILGNRNAQILFLSFFPICFILLIIWIFGFNYWVSYVSFCYFIPFLFTLIFKYPGKEKQYDSDTILDSHLI